MDSRDSYHTVILITDCNQITTSNREFIVRALILVFFVETELFIKKYL